VLLGPVGSGKTTALAAVAEDSRVGVVHAEFDFDRGQPPAVVEVLADLAKQFSNDWKNRPSVHFNRFTLGLLAVQADLNGLSAAQDKETLRKLIDTVFHSRRAERVVGVVNQLAAAAVATNVLTSPMADTIKLLLPPLVKSVSRHALRDAMDWHRDIPQATGASWLDALRTLNQLARREAEAPPGNQRLGMTVWLASAFLADIRENHPRLAKPEPGSPCECEHPDRIKVRHVHNWLLLLDNIGHPGGSEFLGQLAQARERHLRNNPDEHDALVVIAASGRWDESWNALWCPPWIAPPAPPDPRHRVRSCRAARYRDWDRDRPPEELRPWPFPVLLEPLSIDETARALGTSEFDLGCRLAQQATGGLPAALTVIESRLRDHSPAPGARDVLWPVDRDDIWLRRLAQLRIHEHLGHIGIDEFISAAPWATAPWLIPSDAPGKVGRPNVPSILTELRAALWVTVPAHGGGGTPNYTELNPWLARALVSALIARSTSSDDYMTQFEALLTDQTTQFDPVRQAYCQLALGRVSDVVTFFEDSFDSVPHQEWLDRLRLVAGAPDNKPIDQHAGALYHTLVDEDVKAKPDNRTDVRNVVTRLVCALWLARNPFAVPDPALWHTIRDAYVDLRGKTLLSDTAPLTNAATRAQQGQL